jgi:hypothetical protein
MINDLRKVKMFSPVLLNVLYSVCIVLGYKPNEDGMRKMLSAPDLLTQLKEVKQSDIDHKAHLKLDRYLLRKDFNPMFISRSDPTCGILCNWVLAIHSLNAHIILHELHRTPNSKDL